MKDAIIDTLTNLMLILVVCLLVHLLYPKDEPSLEDRVSQIELKLEL